MSRVNEQWRQRGKRETSQQEEEKKNYYRKNVVKIFRNKAPNHFNLS